MWRSRACYGKYLTSGLCIPKILTRVLHAFKADYVMPSLDVVEAFTL